MTGSTRALADLARAANRVLHEPSMQVAFEIHHLADQPGQLAEIVSRDPGGSGFAETLSSSAHGVGLVIGTRIGDSPPGAGSPERQPGAWAELEHQSEGRASFRGSERPSLTFQRESPQTFDGVIAIEDEPRRMLLRHGLAVLDTVRHIAETALQAGEAPVLSVQCPAQLPSLRSLRTGGSNAGRHELARSSSLAVRFSLALQHPSADLRLQIADRLARHCEDRGLGLWLSDTRPGYRAGNWFLVLPHDRSSARAAYRQAGEARRASNAAEGCLPVTLVGPARPGAMHAILSFLGQFPELGVLACSMTVLDELTFLHLQLAVTGASRGRLAAVNRALGELRSGGAGPADVLTRVAHRLRPGGPSFEPPAEERVERLTAQAGDYQTVLGPALPVVADLDFRRVPIWIGWQMRRSDAGLRVPLLALREALGRLGLAESDPDARRGPTIEYLICRQRGGALLHGKGKLGVARAQIEGRSGDQRRGTARLAADLEDAWKARLRASGHDDRFGGVSVSSREFLLGEGHAWT